MLGFLVRAPHIERVPPRHCVLRCVVACCAVPYCIALGHFILPLQRPKKKPISVHIRLLNSARPKCAEKLTLTLSNPLKPRCLYLIWPLCGILYRLEACFCLEGHLKQLEGQATLCFFLRFALVRFKLPS